MPDGEFIPGTDIEQSHPSIAHAADELFSRHRLQAIALVEITVHDLLHLGNVALGDSPQRRQEAHDRLVGEPVKDMLALASGGQKARSVQTLEMLGGVANREPRYLRQRFDAALALSQQFQ